MSQSHKRFVEKSEWPLGVLLIIEQRDAEALAIEQALPQQAELHRTTNLATARELLREKPFEAILVNQDVADDQRSSLLDFIRRISGEVPVVAYTNRDDEAVILETMKAGASDCIRRAEEQQQLSRLPATVQGAVARNLRLQQERERARVAEHDRIMETLRASVAKVTHDINNPLAIISGNAQLLSELGRFMNLDDEIIKPIKDIEEASLRIAMSLNRLAALKDLALHEGAQGDGSMADLDEEAFGKTAPFATPGTGSGTTA